MTAMKGVVKRVIILDREEVVEKEKCAVWEANRCILSLTHSSPPPPPPVSMNS